MFISWLAGSGNIAPVPCCRQTRASTATAMTENSRTKLNDVEQNLTLVPDNDKEEEGNYESDLDSEKEQMTLEKAGKMFAELWRRKDAKRVFSCNYWVPNDPYELVNIPKEELASLEMVYPITDEKNAISKSIDFAVYGGVLEELETGDERQDRTYHVVFNFLNQRNQKRTLSIYRTTVIQEATDLCSSCLACVDMFKLIAEKETKNRRKEVVKILKSLKKHPLWTPVHIAALIGNVQYFSMLKDNDKDNLNRLLNVSSQPEGKYPLMISVEKNNTMLSAFILEAGADPTRVDFKGNNLLHYAALASVQMIECLWNEESVRNLLNLVNNKAETPMCVAVLNANALCAAKFASLGGVLSKTNKNPLFAAMQSKHTTKTVIETIAAMNRDFLKTADPATGNTLLHTATSKKAILALFDADQSNVDVNARNDLGLSPLHQFVYRGDLHCVMAVAALGCDINALTDQGDSALHMAAAQSNLQLVRTLLCLGSDPNIENGKNGHTPRHIAAKLSTNERSDIVRSLEICGAVRCPGEKQDCRSECISLDSNRTRSASSAALEDVKDEATSDTARLPVDDFMHQYCYEKKLKEAEDQRKASGRDASNMINLLALDGGGIRGLVLIQILIEAEKFLDKGDQIGDYFDWIAGTSTGSFLAAGLALGFSLRQVQRVYLSFKDRIFESLSRPFPNEPVEVFMQSIVGVHTLLSDIKSPRIMLPTVLCDRFPVQLQFFRNYQLPIASEQNERMGYHPPEQMTVWKALRCSSAAPTWFSSVDDKYIDGGVISNNPALDLLSEVHTWNAAVRYSTEQHRDHTAEGKQQQQQVTIGCLLSLGTGVAPSKKIESIDTGLPSDPADLFNLPTALKNLGIIMLDQATATDGAPVSRCRSWCHSDTIPYFRLSCPMTADIELDSKDDVELSNLIWDCIEYAHRQRARLRQVVSLLKANGKRRHRVNLFD